MGLSLRHLRREEAAAIELLATYLWGRYDLEGKYAVSAQAPPYSQDVAHTTIESGPTAEQELDWLQESNPNEPLNVAELLQGALSLVGSLADEAGVRVICTPSANSLQIVAQYLALRQALLSLFSTAIHWVPGGAVTVVSHRTGDDVEICVQALPNGSAQSGEQDLEGLEMARRLVHLSGGHLETALDDGASETFSAVITLPAMEQVPVLVVDDNEDALHLVKRHLANTRYHLIDFIRTSWRDLG